MYKGKILKLKTGIIIVPFELKEYGYVCVVVKGNENYPVGGYNICVSDKQIEEGELINIS